MNPKMSALLPYADSGETCQTMEASKPNKDFLGTYWG